MFQSLLGVLPAWSKLLSAGTSRSCRGQLVSYVLPYESNVLEIASPQPQARLLEPERTEPQVQLESYSAPDKVPDYVAMAEDLRNWLSVTYEKLGEITGVGKSTLFSWRDEGVVPRPKSVQRLLRVYATVRAMVSHLGPSEAGAWFHSDSPSLLDLLLAGELDVVENAVHVALFHDTPIPSPNYAAFGGDVDIDVPSSTGGASPRRATRASRRMRLI